MMGGYTAGPECSAIASIADDLLQFLSKAHMSGALFMTYVTPVTVDMHYGPRRFHTSSS